jgi:hypothetical protein
MSEFGSARGESWQIPTPRGEEADRLDYFYDRADELCLMSEARQVKDEEFCRMAEKLDAEGVGGYFRALCDFHNFSLRPRLALHPLLNGTLPVRLPDEPGRPAKPKKKARAGPRICRRNTWTCPAASGRYR